MAHTKVLRDVDATLEIYPMLDRDELSENQLSLLACDILVGDIPVEFYERFVKSEWTPLRVQRNAQKVIDYAHTHPMDMI